ncbi:MAG: chemotaxis protein CheW [Bdellovibrionota bacterium]
MNAATDSLDLADSQVDRYVLFDVGTMRLATPLLSIREIVDPIPCQYVANPYPAFIGLANLRGQIIGVIDSGICFGEDPVEHDKSRKLIVFDGLDTKLGLLVSEVHASLAIKTESIVKEPMIETAIPKAALMGLVKLDRSIIPIVSLSELAKALPELGHAL